MATARLSRQDCAELDRRDPLAAVRERFEPPPAGTVFLDGNSIGPMPRAAADCMLRALREEWSALRRRAWAAADWLDAPQRIGAGYAGLIGARPQDVIACDNTTLNLHKLLVYGLGLAAHDPRRNVIVSEREGFPTDCHVIQGVVHHSRGRWHSRTIESHDELDAALGDDVAMVLLAHVDYRSSLRWDMTAGNRKAHAVGARVLWDLSHSAGAVPVDLTAADADFAVACSYKYLCAGPGAPALAWIRPELQDRGWPALPGWLGHADRMHFASDYAPGPGVMQLITGTMPVLQNKAMEAAAEIWSGIRRRSGVEASVVVGDARRADRGAVRRPGGAGRLAARLRPAGRPRRGPLPRRRTGVRGAARRARRELVPQTGHPPLWTVGSRPEPCRPVGGGGAAENDPGRGALARSPVRRRFRMKLNRTSGGVMRFSNNRLVLLALAAALLVPAVPARAQSYSGPIRVLVGFPPGGGTDVVARFLGDRMKDALGQPILVENRPGAGGMIATQVLKASPPNGSTVMLTIDHTQVIVPLTFKDPGYDPVKDFTPLAGVASYFNAMAVASSINVGSLQDFGAWLKAHPGQANCGVPRPAACRSSPR